MEKFFVILVLTWSVAIDAQPPVNSYLPPNNQNGGPSAIYGPPGFQPGTPLGVRHPDSDRRPGTSYIPLGQNGGGVPETTYGYPGLASNGFGGRRPSSTYKRNGFVGGGPSAIYGTPGSENGSRGVVSNGGGKSSSALGVPVGGLNGRPSSTYGASNQGGNGGRGNGGVGQPHLPPSLNGGLGVYSTGRPGGGNTGEEEGRKYEFQYEINDQQFGTQIGHQESRDGERARGEYNALLPDGRKQIVQYEAGSEGYKPNIYEGGNAGVGGYPPRSLAANRIGINNGGYILGGPGGNGREAANGDDSSSVNGLYLSGNGGGPY